MRPCPLGPKSTPRAKNPRIINLSSAAQSTVSIEALKGNELISSNEAYAQSKLANHLHAKHAGSKYPAEKLISVSVHPGWVKSPLDVHVFQKKLGDSFFGKLAANVIRTIFLLKGDMISPVDGAQTTLHCLLQDAEQMQSGGFYSQFGIYRDDESKPGGWPMPLNNPNVTEELPEALWTLSEKLVGA